MATVHHSTDLYIDRTVSIPPGDEWVLHGCSIIVRDRGHLIAQASAGQPTVIRWDDVDSSGYVGGGMNVLPSDPGLWVLDGGSITLQGAPVTPWALATGVSSTKIALDREPDGWEPGGRIAIAPSRSKNEAGGRFYAETEVATIAGIAGSTVQLSGPLTYPHPADVVQPEVIYLERSVILDGGPDHGPHLFIHGASGTVTLAHVRFANMGHRDVLGRYPVHFHHCGERVARSVFPGVLVENGQQHAVVTHETHRVTWDRAVAFNTRDHAFWWDEFDVSEFVEYRNCVALRVRHEAKGRLGGFFLGRTDRIGSAAIGCRVADVDGRGVDSAGYVWPEIRMPQHKIGPTSWRFEKCLVHNVNHHGLFVWDNDTDSSHITKSTTVVNTGLAGIESGAYGHAYQHLDLRVRGTGNGEDHVGLWLQAGSRHAWGAQQMWIEPVIEDYPVAIRLGNPNVEPFHRVLILRPHFYRCETLIQMLGNPDWNFAPQVDLVCGEGHDVTPSDIQVVDVKKGATLRVQNTDGTAWIIGHDGRVESVDPFW